MDLPDIVTTDQAGRIFFDSEQVDPSSHEGDPDHEARVSGGNRVEFYAHDGEDFQFCVVNDDGPWAFYDSALDTPVVTGKTDQKCSV